MQPIRTDLINTPLLQRTPDIEFGSSQSSETFADLFRRAVNDASALQDNASSMISAFVRGEPVDLHQVMAAAEEASISLELLVEIRNKLTEAYRTLMSIQ